MSQRLEEMANKIRDRWDGLMECEKEGVVRDVQSAAGTRSEPDSLDVEDVLDWIEDLSDD